MNDYITVRQFAESVGVSVQRIYQRIDSDLKPYLKTIKGQKMLSIEGLQLFNKSPLSTEYSSLVKSDDETFKCLSSKLESIQTANAELSAKNSQLLERIQILDNDFKVACKELEIIKCENDSLKAENIDLKAKYNAHEELIIELKSDKKSAAEHLLAKDKQLMECNARIAELTATIKAAQEQQANLTAALTQQQALHAGTLQEHLLQSQEQQPQYEESIGTKESNPKRPSIFARIFKRGDTKR